MSKSTKLAVFMKNIKHCAETFKDSKLKLAILQKLRRGPGCRMFINL